MNIQWQPQPGEERPVQKIIVHRATIRSDMISIIKDPDVIDHNLYATVIDMRGKEEAGEGISVMRDILTQFWHEVYDTLTTGASERSPIFVYQSFVYQSGRLAKDFPSLFLFEY